MNSNKLLVQTKSTFIGVFRREKELIQAKIKEITFEDKGEKIVEETLLI